MMATDAYLYTGLIVIIILIALSLWRFQQRDENTFDLLDLLMEDGRVSRIAAAFAVTLLVTSWIMVKLSIDGKMTEGYLAVYGGLWVAPILTKMFATSPKSRKDKIL